jgi:hypothetical protein
MPSKTFSVDRVFVDDQPMPVRRASIVVRRDDASEAEIGLFDWEVSAHGDEKRWLVQGEYRLRLESRGDGDEDRVFEGRAILTTTDGTSHLFRGLGKLGGFEQSEFAV